MRMYNHQKYPNQCESLFTSRLKQLNHSKDANNSINTNNNNHNNNNTNNSISDTVLSSDTSSNNKSEMDYESNASSDEDIPIAFRQSRY